MEVLVLNNYDENKVMSYKKMYLSLRQVFTKVLPWKYNQHFFLVLGFLKDLPCANCDFSKFQFMLLFESNSLFYLNTFKTILSQIVVLCKYKKYCISLDLLKYFLISQLYLDIGVLMVVFSNVKSEMNLRN